jgi:hypothetical protein
MATCPQGHPSTDPDFCDVCGRQIAGSSGPVSAGSTPVAATPPAAAPEGERTPCPACGEPRTGRFCEECSYDFESGIDPNAVVAWLLAIAPDRAHYQRTLDEGGAEEEIDVPDQLAPRTVALQGNEITIGRHSRSAGWTPDVDLAGPPADPGISHRHAVLRACPDGGWSVQDTDSTNGTTVNDDPVPISAAVPLADGDRIHLGAWTTLTLRRAHGGAA